MFFELQLERQLVNFDINGGGGDQLVITKSVWPNFGVTYLECQWSLIWVASSRAFGRQSKDGPKIQGTPKCGVEIIWLNIILYLPTWMNFQSKKVMYSLVVTHKITYYKFWHLDSTFRMNSNYHSTYTLSIRLNKKFLCLKACDNLEDPTLTTFFYIYLFFS